MKTSKARCDVAITVKLDDLLYERRMTLTELAERVGLTLANLSILKTGKARAIRFSTLDAICEALSCQPGDILQFEREFDPEQAESEQTATAGRKSASRHLCGAETGIPAKLDAGSGGKPNGIPG